MCSVFILRLTLLLVFCAAGVWVTSPHVNRLWVALSVDQKWLCIGLFRVPHFSRCYYHDYMVYPHSSRFGPTWDTNVVLVLVLFQSICPSCAYGSRPKKRMPSYLRSRTVHAQWSRTQFTGTQRNMAVLSIRPSYTCKTTYITTFCRRVKLRSI